MEYKKGTLGTADARRKISTSFLKPKLGGYNKNMIGEFFDSNVLMDVNSVRAKPKAVKFNSRRPKGSEHLFFYCRFSLK